VCPVVLRLVPDVYAVHEPPSKRYSRTSAMVPVPPEPAVAVADTLDPVQTAPAAGEGVSVPATGRAVTVQLTWLEVEVEQPEPEAVLLLSIRLVPVTAAKLGTEEDHALHVELLSVEYLYSSAVVPEPPLPAVMLTVRVCPEQTEAATGLLVIAGATGWATTVQLSITVDEVVHPEPVAVR
jgi:hypothetical protein